MARRAHRTQLHEELIHIAHRPRPRILTGERPETGDDLLTAGDRREGKVAAQLLIPLPVQHRLEHLLGRVEQRHIPGDLLHCRSSRATLIGHVFSSHNTRHFRTLCETVAKWPATARILRLNAPTFDGQLLFPATHTWAVRSLESTRYRAIRLYERGQVSKSGQFASNAIRRGSS